MGLVLLALFIMLIFGIVEFRKHQQHIHAIPIRVNVNGVRGKSTVTRLITGILTQSGLRTVGKTTGTSARMIYWYTEEESPIKRRKEGPNIGEQRKVVAEAAQLEAEALVSECMAVNPDYQITFQRQMLQANIGVIVNVLEDHMDVLGPTLDEVAESFTATIPYNGHLIITDGPYRPYFEKIAADRNTQVIVADPSRFSESYLRQFSYVMFADNAALAMAVAQALDIDEQTALQGMLQAHPDPGALKVLPLVDPYDGFESMSYFINGFAANDAASTLNIWERAKELGYPSDAPIVIMNCRPDRVDRTEQFANDVLPYIHMSTLVLIGSHTTPIKKAYEQGEIAAQDLVDLAGYAADDIFEQIQKRMPGRVIYGIGNIHGDGEPLIELFEQLYDNSKHIELSAKESAAAKAPDGEQRNQANTIYVEKEPENETEIEFDTEAMNGTNEIKEALNEADKERIPIN